MVVSARVRELETIEQNQVAAHRVTKGETTLG